MENTISFNTKFGWITAIESDNKITRIQFMKVKRKGDFTKKNMERVKKNKKRKHQKLW